jgi:hypothetical protein
VDCYVLAEQLLKHLEVIVDNAQARKIGSVSTPPDIDGSFVDDMIAAHQVNPV